MVFSPSRDSLRSAFLVSGLRTALEDWQGECLGQPWGDIVEHLARVIEAGQVTLEDATRLDHLLRSTTGDTDRVQCATCHCPIPGVTHFAGYCVTCHNNQAQGGGCPDPRLHASSFDGKCRYCRDEYDNLYHVPPAP